MSSCSGDKTPVVPAQLFGLTVKKACRAKLSEVNLYFLLRYLCEHCEHSDLKVLQAKAKAETLIQLFHEKYPKLAPLDLVCPRNDDITRNAVEFLKNQKDEGVKRIAAKGFLYGYDSVSHVESICKCASNRPEIEAFCSNLELACCY